MIYYVDSLAGDNTNSGLGSDAPWRSLAKVAAARLLPGDQVLFRRDRTWLSTSPKALIITASGTADAPIILGSYGEGAPPQIVLDGLNKPGDRLGVELTGNYVQSELNVTLRNPNLIATANGPLPFGWYVGYRLSGDHLTLEGAELDHLALGVHLPDRSHHNTVRHCQIHDQDALWRLRKGGASAMGGLGMLIWGDNHLIEDVDFYYNGASAGPDKADGYSAPHEFFNCDDVVVRHCFAKGHRKHAEAGRDSTHTCKGIIFEGNVWLSDVADARGPNLHDDKPDAFGLIFGPVEGTIFRYNTVLFTGPRSVCIYSSWPGIVLVDNILDCGPLGQIGAIVTPLVEARNYYSATPNFVGAKMASSSIMGTDPLLDADYRPKAGSPCLGTGEAGSNIGAVQPLTDAEIIAALKAERDQLAHTLELEQADLFFARQAILTEGVARDLAEAALVTMTAERDRLLAQSVTLAADRDRLLASLAQVEQIAHAAWVAS